MNFLMGKKGIVSNAMNARVEYEKSKILEAIQMEFATFNSNMLINKTEAILDILNKSKANGTIDWASANVDENGKYTSYNLFEDEDDRLYMWVKKSDYSYRIILGNNNTFIVEEMRVSGPGRLYGGIFIVTKDLFSSKEDYSNPEDVGKISISGKTTVIFDASLGTDENGINASGESFSLLIEKKAKVKAYFNFDEANKAEDGKTYYRLTNEGLKRSAIDIASTGTLDMFISKNVVVIVDSGTGATAPINTGKGAVGGNGGYAGIRVPVGATLNLRGEGEIIAIGGNAGFGGTAVSGDAGGGRRRWSWRWNWWQWSDKAEIQMGLLMLEVLQMLELVKIAEKSIYMILLL